MTATAVRPIPTLPSFVGDLRLALSAWRTAPGLPVVTVVVAALSAAPFLFVDDPAAFGGASLLVLPVSVFWIGFRGTARVWYVRAWQRSAMPAGEVWMMSWRLLGRMLLLGLLVAGPQIVAVLVFFGAVYPAGLSAKTTFDIAISITAFLVDAALTFVVPAIVFSTTSPTVACRLGFAMAKKHWRQAAAYLLTPPLALAIVSRLFVNAFSHAWMYVVVQIAIALVDLLFKGAITAYYLRYAPPPAPVTYGPPPPIGDPLPMPAPPPGRHR